MTLGHQRKVKVVLFLLHSEHYIRSVKHRPYIYTTKWIYLHPYWESLSHRGDKDLPTSSSDLCVSSVSLLVTWLWFVLLIIDSQLACPVVLVTVFHVDRDQNDPTIPWEYTRKAGGSVIWAICLLWPERELKTMTFLMSCTLLWRRFENCFAENTFELTKLIWYALYFSFPFLNVAALEPQGIYNSLFCIINPFSRCQVSLMCTVLSWCYWS